MPRDPKRLARIPPAALKEARAQITAQAAVRAAAEHDLAVVVLVYPHEPGAEPPAISMMGHRGSRDAVVLHSLLKTAQLDLEDYSAAMFEEPERD